MKFSTYCTNKECGNFNEPYLDNDKVYCSLCDLEIPNITPFTKNQMKMNKQVKQSSKKPYSVKCPNCKKENTPKITNKSLSCPHCNDPLNNLTSIFKNILIQQIKAGTEVK